jgi:hypothetical protein
MTTQHLPGIDAGELEAWFKFDTPESSGPDEDPFECWSPGPGPGAVYEEAYDLACITRYERHVAAVQGEQTVAMAGFVASYVRDHRVWFPTAGLDEARRSAYAEIALALGIADRTSDARVAVACDLVERLPGTVAAMCSGQVTLSRARVILEETVHLEAEQRAVVEETMLAKAAGLTPGNLRRSTRRLVEKLDAEAVVKRREAAKADRWLRFWELPDGMAGLEARLSAADAAAVFGVIDELAHAARGPQDPRSIDQLRADALVDVVLHPVDLPDRVRYTINLTVPADVLLGATGIDTLQAAAAAFTGTGIDSDLAQAVAADATWHRILTDPATGDVVDANPRRYRPSHRLAEHIRARDQHCRFPGCRQAAHRADIDHTVPAEDGGPTIRRNLAALCRKHHRLKHLPGWRCEQTDHGQLTFTTPSGRTYRTRPPTAHGEDHPTY